MTKIMHGRIGRAVMLAVAAVMASAAIWVGTAGAQEAFVGEGDISGANPTGIGATEGEFAVNSCPDLPESQGADGWVFQLPSGFVSAGKIAKVTGTTASPEHDLDLQFYDADCAHLGSSITGDADETAPLPPKTGYVVVNQALGAETHICLVVGTAACPTGGASATATSTSTARPSGSASSTGSASPSGSPGSGDITTTIATDRTKVKFRAPFTLRGEVTADPSCERPFLVSIRRRVHGTRSVQTIEERIPVSDNNLWSRKITSKVSADYAATVQDSGACGDGTSGTVAVRVAAKVGVIVPASCAAPQAIEGRVSPNHRGSKVSLQAREGKKWRPRDSAKLNRKSRFRLVAPSCEGSYRVVWPAADPRNLKGAKTFRF